MANPAGALIFFVAAVKSLNSVISAANLYKRGAQAHFPTAMFKILDGPDTA